MKTWIAMLLIASSGTFGMGQAVAANERGTEADAQAMVKQAVAFLKTAGAEKAYKSFTDHPDGAFKDRDLYVFVYDYQGNCLAQGANSKMVGKNLIEMRDADGNYLIKGMIDLVKAKTSGWYGPYKFANPTTQQYESKKSYCEKGIGDTMVCVGAYFAK